MTKLTLPDLAGKAVLITGASTGIGAALARAFAAQGALVSINYHSSEAAAKALLQEIEAAGGKAMLVKGDVTKPAECADIVAKTAERFGRIDGLINNAGLMLGRVPSLEADEAHVEAVIALNVRSVISVTRFAKPWLARQGGFVINTTSIAARNGGGGGAVLYAASKGFVSTLTKGLVEGTDRGENPRQRRRARRHRDAVPRALQQRRGDGGDAQDRPDGPRGNAGGLRRRVSVPRLGGAERLRHRPDHRGQRRPVDAVRAGSVRPVSSAAIDSAGSNRLPPRS